MRWLARHNFCSLLLSLSVRSAPSSPTMSFLFGKSKTPAEIMREHQRTIQRATRELYRERKTLDKQENKLVA